MFEQGYDGTNAAGVARWSQPVKDIWNSKPQSRTEILLAAIYDELCKMNSAREPSPDLRETKTGAVGGRKRGRTYGK